MRPSPLRALPAAALVIGMFADCGGAAEGTGPPNPSNPGAGAARLAVLSEKSIADTIDGQDHAFTVQLTNASGYPEPNVDIDFTLVYRRDSSMAGSSETQIAAQGWANFTVSFTTGTDSAGRAGGTVRIGSEPDSLLLLAEVSKSSLRVGVPVTVLAGAPAHVTASVTDTGLVAGASLRPTYSAIDRDNNTVTSGLTFSAGLGVSVDSAGRITAGPDPIRTYVLAGTGAAADSIPISVVPATPVIAAEPQSGGYSLVVMQLDGHVERTLVSSGPADGMMQPVVAPGGQPLYFVNAGIQVREADGSTHPLLAPGTGPAGQAWPAPGTIGSWVYFVGTPSGQGATIYEVHPDGTALARIGPAYASGVGIDREGLARDGKSLIVEYRSSAGGAESIGRFDLAADTVAKLSEVGTDPALAPDGEHLAYADANGGITVTDLTTGATSRFLAGDTLVRELTQPWTADGKWLVAVDGASVDLLRVADGRVVPMPYLAGYLSVVADTASIVPIDTTAAPPDTVPADTTPPPPPPSGAQQSLTIISGADLADTVQSLPETLTVIARDSAGAPVAGQRVSFAVARVADSIVTGADIVSVGPTDTGPFADTVTITTDTTGTATAHVHFGTLADSVLIVARGAAHAQAVGHARVLPGKGVAFKFLTPYVGVLVGDTASLGIYPVDRLGNRALDTVQYQTTGGITIDSTGLMDAGSDPRLVIVTVIDGALTQAMNVSVVPDLTMLAVAPPGELYQQYSLDLVRLDGHRTTTVVGNASTTGDAEPAIGPGGVLYFVDPQSIQVREPDGSIHPLIPSPSPIFGSWPAPTADGQWVYFIGYGAQLQRILFRVHPDGTGLAQIGPSPTDGYHFYSATMAPDGGSLIVSYTEAGTSGAHIGRFDLATDSITALPASGKAASLSPDGTQLAYTGAATGKALEVLDLASDSTRDLMPGASVMTLQHPWTADGNWLIGSAGGLPFLVRVADGRLIPLLYLTNYTDILAAPSALSATRTAAR